MSESLSSYPQLLQGTIFFVFAVSAVLIVVAILSAKSMGGKLGMGLKKIAAGAIMYALLFFFILLLQNGWETSLTPSQLQVFLLSVALMGSGVLISGFYQIYKISKELKLFY